MSSGQRWQRGDGHALTDGLGGGGSDGYGGDDGGDGGVAIDGVHDGTGDDAGGGDARSGRDSEWLRTGTEAPQRFDAPPGQANWRGRAVNARA